MKVSDSVANRLQFHYEFGYESVATEVWRLIIHFKLNCVYKCKILFS